MKTVRFWLIASLSLCSLAVGGVKKEDPFQPIEAVLSNLRQNCQRDFAEQCPGKVIGQGLLKCVRENHESFSQACTSALSDARTQLRQARRR